MTTAKTDSDLLIEIDSRGVARLTLNRPQVHNAFDERLIDRIADAIAQLGTDPAVRVVVIAATGKVFCAGADITWMQRAAANDFESNLDDARRFAAMMSAIDRCEKPVVVRIQGPAYGGGVGIACAADIAICSHAARFCVSEARFGILPAVIGPHLMNAIGARQARRLALSCEVIDAAQALAIGLVHLAVEEPQLDHALDACIRDLLRAGPLAQGHVQALFAQLDRCAVSDEIQELTSQTISRVRTTAEAREGFAAFNEKRRPSWTSGI